MSSLYYQDKQLFIEKIALREIVNRYGTPLYVYSLQTLKKNWQQFENAFQGINHQVCYAVKANSNLSLLTLFSKWGAGFDIVSLGELKRVYKIQGHLNNVIFSGVGKTTAEIKEAIQLNIHSINVESLSELTRIQAIASQLNTQVNISLRLNLNISADTHSYIATGQLTDKFGIPLEEMDNLFKIGQQFPLLKLIGIGSHIGSQILDLAPLVENAKQLVSLAANLENHGIVIQHINIGGGTGIRYNDENSFDMQGFGQQIANCIPKKFKIIMEPGRALVGNAGVLLTHVEYIKGTAVKKFAIVDAGMNDLIRPSLYDAWHNILPFEIHSSSKEIYDVVGPVCESGDFFAKDRSLAIQEGDYLAIDTTGAYGFSMSSHYNSRLLPAEVLIDNDKITMIRKRETYDNLMALEVECVK